MATTGASAYPLTTATLAPSPIRAALSIERGLHHIYRRSA